MTPPPDPARRSRSPRGEAATLAEEIVTAALRFLDDGREARALTLRGLARTVGVSAPAIYAHFANTDAILLAVAERVFADLAEQLRAAGQEHGEAPAQRLRALCRSYLDYAEARPGRYLVMFGGQWDARVAVDQGAVEAEPVLDLGQDVLAAFTSAVGACTGGPDPEVATRALRVWVLLHGYAHQRLVASAFPWPPDMTERLLDDALRIGCP